MYSIPPLPYDDNALEPVIGSKTVRVHYGKHHQGYAEKLNKALAEDPQSIDSAEELVSFIQSTQSDKLHNLAAQVWNHEFYWNSMSPNGGGSPPEAVDRALSEAFGSTESFLEKFSEAAQGEFGSGWAWLVMDSDGSLSVTSTTDANTPLTGDTTPLLTIDVWEHAYYLDHMNRRDTYVQGFCEQLINWEFLANNLELARSAN